jgi:peptidoglycan/xylan/chitin deacetylase (PgdA/CDA1 family)
MSYLLLSSCAILMILAAGCSRESNHVLPEKGKVIVLMYHRITAGEAGNLYERSVADLENDFKYLEDNKIKVLTFNDLQDIANSGEMPNGNAAVLTFDDGDHSWYTLVKPILLKYKIKATFFLWTNMVGENSFITWQEVEDMSNYVLPGGEHPFVFGSHTCSHVYLYSTKGNYSNDEEYNAFLDYQLGVSREEIEQHTPRSVTSLSLPFGDGAGDPEIIAAARRNGYKFIRTSVWGAIQNASFDLYAIPSLPMLDTTEPDLIGYYLGL